MQARYTRRIAYTFAFPKRLLRSTPCVFHQRSRAKRHNLAVYTFGTTVGAQSCKTPANLFRVFHSHEVRKPVILYSLGRNRDTCPAVGLSNLQSYGGTYDVSYLSK